MKTIPFTLKPESEESQYKAKRHNPAQVAVFKDGRKMREEVIGAGTSDYGYLFKEGKDFIILSINYRLGYLGIEILGSDRNIFLQNDQNIKDFFGKKTPLPIHRCI